MKDLDRRQDPSHLDGGEPVRPGENQTTNDLMPNEAGSRGDGSSETGGAEEDGEPGAGAGGEDAREVPERSVADDGAGEHRVPKKAMTPVEPRMHELEEHRLSGHATYRNWCDACVTGQGLATAHRCTGEEPLVPVLS